MTIENASSGVKDGVAIEIKGGVDDVRIGAAGKGFTIKGSDSTFTASDYASILIFNSADPYAGLVIEGNRVTANGEGGLTTMAGADISGAQIVGNIFDGQTFVGTNPGGMPTGFNSTTTRARAP